MTVTTALFSVFVIGARGALPAVARGATILLAALLTATSLALPLFYLHPMAVLYVFTTVCTWVGRPREGLTGIAVAATYALLIPVRYAALPSEVIIFSATATLEWGLLCALRVLLEETPNRRTQGGIS